MPNGASEAELPHPARYVAEENTVRDEVTGLVWQQDTESSDTTWEGARARCASLKLDGGGWALPTRIELVSLVDPTRSSPAIAPEISLVTGTPSLLFWTASPAASGDSLAWAVDFGVGQAVLAPKSTLALVRCVR
jgi:hypothetical protein